MYLDIPGGLLGPLIDRTLFGVLNVGANLVISYLCESRNHPQKAVFGMLSPLELPFAGLSLEF